MFRTDDDHPSIKPKALLVNLEASSPEGKTARELLDAMNIAWHSVGNEALDRTVADNLEPIVMPTEDPERAHIREDEPDGSEVPDDVQMIVMAAFTRPELEKFLNDYRDTDAPPVRLKAVATHNNFGWKLRSLAHELEREQQTMSLYNVLVRAVQAVEMMNHEDYTPESWSVLESLSLKAADQVNRIRNQVEVPIPEMRETWDSLQTAVNGLIPSLDDEED